MNVCNTWIITRYLVSVVLFIGLAEPAQSQDETKRDLRVGVIGLDTSHASAFSRVLNNPEQPPELSGCRVVAAVFSHSPNVAESVRYLPKVTKEIQALGIDIVPSIDELLKRVDVVLLESIDGNPHLKQALPVLRARKPLFVDKPVAGSLADVVLLYDVAKHFETPVFSSSSLRYTDGAKAIVAGSVGDVTACDAFSPCPIEPTHPDFFWYGIHGVETLFTVMGPGCEMVTRVHSANTDVAVGRWRDGRIGTFRGRRKDNNGYAGGYGGTAFGTKGIEAIGGFSGYEPLLVEIVRFFKTRKPPVTADETIEIYTFMEAADESKRQGGKPVKMEDVLRKATEAAAGLEKDVKVPLPPIAKPAEPARRIVVHVAADGQVTLDGTRTDVEELAKRLTSARSKDQGLGVLIRTDAKLPFQEVTRVIDTCSKAGFRDVQIAIRKAAAKE